MIVVGVQLFACAGSPVKRDGSGSDAKSVRSGSSATGPVPVATRALLLFDDANKTAENQRKAGISDPETLKRKYQAALDVDPNLAEASYNLGVIAQREGNDSQAATQYRNALKVKPSLKEAAENLGVLSQEQGDVPTAVQIYQDVAKQHPEDASSRARLAEIYRQNGEYDRAMSFARQALVRDSRSVAAYKVMMATYLDRKQLSMAKLVAIRALKISEADPELHYTVGLILLQEQDQTKALVQFKRALEVKPDHLPSHIILAKLALKNENYPRAEQHLRSILQADAKNAEAHLNLGVAYKEQGLFDKAMQEYDIADSLSPKLAIVSLNRAIILHRYKDAPERALEYYKKYVAMVGETSLPADAPVFGLMKEAEQVVDAKAQAKVADEQAKKLESAQKLQQSKIKEEESRVKVQSKDKEAPEADPLDEKVEEAGKDQKQGQVPPKLTKVKKKAPAAQKAD